MSIDITWPVTGGCHCGAIRYEIDETPLNSGMCHCRDCQKASGAPLMVWVDMEPSKFRFTKGQPAIHESSNFAQRGFCADCGTCLTYAIKERPEEIDVAVATLDDPDVAPPSFQIFPKSSPRFMHGFDKELPVKDVESYFSGLRER